MGTRRASITADAVTRVLRECAVILFIGTFDLKSGQRIIGETKKRPAKIA